MSEAPQSPPPWRVLKAERASADRILRAFGVTQPAVDIEGLARRMGIEVKTVPGPEWSGSITSDERNATILVSADEQQFRRRFTIAHEIAHLMLHPLGQEFRDLPDFSGDAHEAQANGYAANLLMPLWMLDPIATQYKGDVRALARIFDVSEAAMSIRLGKLAGL